MGTIGDGTIFVNDHPGSGADRNRDVPMVSNRRPERALDGRSDGLRRLPVHPLRTMYSRSSGNRRATTPAPRTHRIPPDTTANWGPMSDATMAASMSPMRGPLVTTRNGSTSPGLAGGPASRAARASSGRRPRRRPRRRRAPGTASASGNETSTSPNAAIGEAPDHDAATIARPARRDRRDPAREQRPEERAGRRRRRHEPEAGRPDPNTSSARTGKSAVGMPKIIALRSMTNDAEDRPSVAGEAQALADRLEPGPDDGAERWQRRDRQQGHERRDERREVDGVGAGQPDRRDEASRRSPARRSTRPGSSAG